MSKLMIFSFVFSFLWIGIPLGILFAISHEPWMKRWSRLSCSVGLAFLLYYIGVITVIATCASAARTWLNGY